MSDDPLAREIEAAIDARGGLPVGDYMDLCLSHPTHGYYMAREPFGAAGDFVTAPEISQMFGEIVAMWCLNVWQAMGAPHPFVLAELGPGRGTLMADMLRAGRVRPQFVEAARVHLVERSPRLRAAQKAALGGAAAAWHDGVSGLPELPAIIVANEFFDALPVSQYVFTHGAWRERLVVKGEDGLAFGPGPDAAGLAGLPGSAPEGAIAERAPVREAVAGEIAARLARHGGAALIIDYGYPGPALGDTLQAVSRHGFADPLADPGRQDITAHVDFSALKEAAERAGARATAALPQGAFLEALGIAMRARMLARAEPGQAREIGQALARLTGEEGMGALFKAMAFLAPGLEPPPPF